MRTCTRRVFTFAAFLAAILSTGCGNGKHSSTPALPPVFISTPSNTAAEGAAYSYQLAATAPDGGAISYFLTAAPTGSTLNGTTLSWIPSPSQSRQPNTFSVSATTEKGATATQTWTVTPSGTIHVSWVDTEWSEFGPTAKPHDWTLDLTPAALFLQPDGSILSFVGSGDVNGHLYIPSVPAGYYWLQAFPGAFYWTSSSDIDLGRDYHAPHSLTQNPSGISTKLNLNIAGFEPFHPTLPPFPMPPDTHGTFLIHLTSQFSELMIYLPSGRLLGSIVLINWDLRNFQIPFTTGFDLSGIETGSVLEYMPTSFGSMNGTVLGPTALLSNLSIANGESNNIDVPLIPSPQKSISLSINGSAWQPLFTNIAPGTVTPYGTPFSVSVESDVSRADIRVPDSQRTISLLSSTPRVTGPPTGGGLFPLIAQTSCGEGFLVSSTTSAPPVLLSHQDLGTVQYGDPFPESWARYVTVCQQATADVPTPDGSSTQKIILSNGVTLPTPGSPLNPLIGPVETPTINDRNLFTASTVSEPGVTLKWTKPSLGNPIGYVVSVYTDLAIQNRTVYARIATLSTAKTTLMLPPSLLHTGKTYLFLITALTDGRANLESSPNRLGFPAGNADIISAPITIGEL